MTASQVTALPAQSSLCGQTGTGSSKPSLPETVCLGARSCLSPLQLLHWMFQGKIFHQQDCVLCIIFMENIQFQPWRHEAFVMRPWCCLGLTWVNVGHNSQRPRWWWWHWLVSPLSPPDLNLRTFWWAGSAPGPPTTHQHGRRQNYDDHVPGKFPCFKSVTQGPRLSITMICPRGKEKQTELNV